MLESRRVLNGLRVHFCGSGVLQSVPAAAYAKRRKHVVHGSNVSQQLLPSPPLFAHVGVVLFQPAMYWGSFSSSQQTVLGSACKSVQLNVARLSMLGMEESVYTGDAAVNRTHAEAATMRESDEYILASSD